MPSIGSLRASALQNNSILVEWELEYDGGHPITLLEIHVALHVPRPPHSAMPTPPDLVYHVMQGGMGRLVTRGVEPGHTYTATATATNTLGPSAQQTDNGNYLPSHHRNSWFYFPFLQCSWATLTSGAVGLKWAGERIVYGLCRRAPW